MFDSLLGRKFSARCKTSIKCIKERIFLIRKKKLAMLNFLKKDIADLLANGHEDVALGRIEGLIEEMNHTSCYDIIEKFCEYVLKQLPCLQKQKECPEEDREALSTLIFAAARFSDLPELCDLRRVFTARYGSAMESFVNSEFVEKTTMKSFSTDRKLQLMRDIAQEFSIQWDFEAFKYKMSNPFRSVPGRPKKVEPLSNVKEDRPFYEPPANGRNEKAINVKNQEISYNGIHEPKPVIGAQKYEQRKPKDVHVIPDTKGDSQLGHIRKTKGLSNEPENVEPHCMDSTTSKVRQKGNGDGNQKDDQHVTRIASGRAARVQEELDPISEENWAVGKVKNKDDKPVNLAPQMKLEVKNKVNHRQDSNAYVVNDRPLEARQGSDVVSRVRHTVGQGNSEHDCALSMVPPPYTKPKASHVTKSSDPAVNKHTVNDGSNVDGSKNTRTDSMVVDGDHRPKSVRRKHTRPPKVHENENAVDHAVPEDQILSGRRKHDVGLRTPKFEDSHDEEEKVMDRLLMHYSKKEMSEPSIKSRIRKKVTSEDHVDDAGEIGEHEINGRAQLDTAETVHAPARAVSLPPEPVNPVEGMAAKGHLRATSMQSDLASPMGARVHPRLPDYDELAARFIALKKG